MASELVRRVWCDVHAAESDERVPVSESGEGIALQVGQLSGTVDLCDACIAEHLKPLAEFVESYARAEDAVKTAKPADPLSCRLCGKRYAYRNSLRSHMVGVHHTTPEPVRAALPDPCKYCSYVAGAMPGLAAHIRSNHPDKWRGSVRASYKAS